MKLYSVVLVLVLLAGCGYSSKDNEMVGQVKKVVKNTPIICPDFMDADISLGVMRGGSGSMSSEDVWGVITDKDQEKILREANETGALVKIRFDVKRFAVCTGDHIISSVEIVK